MQNSSQQNLMPEIDNGESSYVNLTSQQLLPPRQQQQDQNNPQAPPAIRQSTRAKYQRMKLTIQYHQQFFKNYLQKTLSCPITYQPMHDPVIAQSGKTFERKNILDWLRTDERSTCPQTRIPIKDKLYPNYSIKSLSQGYENLLKKIRDEQRLLRRQQHYNQNEGRLTISQYQKQCTKVDINRLKHLLDHSYKEIKMVKFVRVNWYYFQEMNLCQCGINDQGIELLLQHGNDQFKNVAQLNIESNKITQIKQISRLPKLRKLYVGDNKELTLQTIKYLQDINESQEFKVKKRKLKVHFNIKPL